MSGSLSELWPDPDRRSEALLSCLCHVYEYEPQVLTPMETRTLEALSHGLENSEAAVVLGVTLESIKSHAKVARRKLRAKNSTAACCEALRQGLIH